MTRSRCPDTSKLKGSDLVNIQYSPEDSPDCCNLDLKDWFVLTELSFKIFVSIFK